MKVSNPLILIIDEIPRSLKIASLALRGEGYRVLQVTGAEVALHYILEYGPSLVILDVNVSCADGTSLVQLLRSDRRTRSLPVIALITDVEKYEFDEVLAVGMTDYVPHFINVRDFFHIVAQHVPKPYGGFPFVGEN